MLNTPYQPPSDAQPMYIYPYIPQWPLHPPLQQLNALHRQVTITHPVISLMAHTGDDIEQVIRVTTTLLRGVSIKLKQSNVGPND